MFRHFLRQGGLIALVPLIIALIVGSRWMQLALVTVPATDPVVLQGEVLSKVTYHTPTAVTTNGQTIQRMREDYVVTVAIDLPGLPTPYQTTQKVHEAFYLSVHAQSPVEVKFAPASLDVIEMKPGIVAKPFRHLGLWALAMCMLAIGIGWVAWQRAASGQRGGQIPVS